MQKKIKEKIRYYAPVFVAAAVIIILLIVPTGYENRTIYQETERVSARVISTDNSMIIDTGLIRYGEQSCEIVAVAPVTALAAGFLLAGKATE